ncbi:MAG: DUF2924 domain-containing protein [Alphaproteobacteria bacterium]
MQRDISKIALDIGSLNGCSLAQLQAQWTTLASKPLKGARRDLLQRAIAYLLQDQEGGGLSAKTRQRLGQLAKTYAKDRSAQAQMAPDLKPGCRLLREWQGVMHEVVVLEQGFQHDDRTYRSLSEIARTITGTRWSGPLFFGLKKPAGTAQPSHAGKIKAER